MNEKWSWQLKELMKRNKTSFRRTSSQAREYINKHLGTIKLNKPKSLNIDHYQCEVVGFIKFYNLMIDVK